MAGRSRFEESEGRVSIIRILDDTVEELGLPGLRDLLPPPQEIISETLGLPTLNDIVKSMKEGILRNSDSFLPRLRFPPLRR